MMDSLSLRGVELCQYSVVMIIPISNKFLLFNFRKERKLMLSEDVRSSRRC